MTTKTVAQEQEERTERINKLVEHEASELRMALQLRERADKFEELEEILDKFHDICQRKEGEVKSVLTRLRSKIHEFTRRHFTDIIEQESRPF